MISVGIFKNFELSFSPSSNSSQAKPFLSVYIRLASFKSLQCCFNVCITHANLIASIGALLGHLLNGTYEDNFLFSEYTVELVMMFVKHFHAITDTSIPSQMPLSGTAKEI